MDHLKGFPEHEIHRNPCHASEALIRPRAFRKAVAPSFAGLAGQLGGADEGSAFGPVGIPFRSDGTAENEQRNVHRVTEVHGPGVVADEERAFPGDVREFRERPPFQDGNPFSGGLGSHFIHPQDLDAGTREPACEVDEILRAPPCGLPAGTGVDEDPFFAARRRVRFTPGERGPGRSGRSFAPTCFAGEEPEQIPVVLMHGPRLIGMDRYRAERGHVDLVVGHFDNGPRAGEACGQAGHVPLIKGDEGMVG